MGRVWITKACQSGGSPRGIFSTKYAMLAIAGQSESLPLQHNSSNKWLSAKMWGRRMQFTTHSGTVRFWNWWGWEGSWQMGGTWELPSRRRRGPAGLPRAPTCACPAPDRFKSQLVSLESAAQGFPKQTRLLSQRTTPSFSYTHSRLGTKRRCRAAASSAGSFPASVRTRKSPLVSRHQDPVPTKYHSSQKSPSASHSPCLGGRRLARRPAAPRFSTFSLRPAWAGAKTRKGGLGKAG